MAGESVRATVASSTGRVADESPTASDVSVLASGVRDPVGASDTSVRAMVVSSTGRVADESMIVSDVSVLACDASVWVSEVSLVVSGLD